MQNNEQQHVKIYVRKTKEMGENERTLSFMRPDKDSSLTSAIILEEGYGIDGNQAVIGITAGEGESLYHKLVREEQRLLMLLLKHNILGEFA